MSSKDYLPEQIVDKVNHEIQNKVGELRKKGIIDQSHYSVQVPLLYNKFRKSELIFIGLNPSSPMGELKDRFRIISEYLEENNGDDNVKNKAKYFQNNVNKWEQEAKNKYQGNGNKQNRVKHFWSRLSDDLNNCDKEIKDELLKLEHSAAKGELKPEGFYAKYFGTISKLTNNVSSNFDWEHLDLFPLRASSKEELKQVLKLGQLGEGNKLKVGNEFFNSYKSLLDHEKLKAVVVNSAYSWEAIYPLTRYNDETGCYWLDNIPVFPVGMLTSGNVDEGSRERLEWHIRFVLDKAGIL